MSDGRKAMYEDMEEEYQQQRMEKLKKMDPHELLNIIAQARITVDYLYSRSLLLSWEQHSRFQTLKKELEKLP